MAENYRAQPIYSSSVRASVYDAPKEVILQENQTISSQEKAEIQDSVHAAFLRFG